MDEEVKPCSYKQHDEISRTFPSFIPLDLSQNQNLIIMVTHLNHSGRKQMLPIIVLFSFYGVEKHDIKSYQTGKYSLIACAC